VVFVRNIDRTSGPTVVDAAGLGAVCGGLVAGSWGVDGKKVNIYASGSAPESHGVQVRPHVRSNLVTDECIHPLKISDMDQNLIILEPYLEGPSVRENM
jgi:hypothetical protein